MKDKIKNKIEASCKHYGINSTEFRNELIDSYNDQYDELIHNGSNKELAYEQIVKSLDDLSYYTDYSANQSNHKTNRLYIWLNITINAILIIFYLFSKYNNLFETDYSIAVYLIIGLFITIPILVVGFVKDVRSSKRLIKNYLITLLLYIPIGLYEIDGGISNHWIQSVLSYYTITVTLGIMIGFAFDKKINLQWALIGLSSLMLFVTRFLYNQSVLSFILISVAFTIFILTLIWQLWKGLFNQSKRKIVIFLSLVIVLIGSVVEALIFRFLTVDALYYHIVILGLIIIFSKLFTYIFKGIKGWRYVYQGSVIYLIIVLLVQLGGLVYQTIQTNFYDATVNFYSVQLSILSVLIVIVLKALKIISKEKENG